MRYIQGKGMFTKGIRFCSKHVTSLQNGRRKLIKIKRVPTSRVPEQYEKKIMKTILNLYFLNPLALEMDILISSTSFV